MQLGFIGAGRIGQPMIGRLVVAGHQVRVLDRSQAACAAAAASGAVIVDDLPQAAADADAVVLCPYSDAQLRDLALDRDLLALMPHGSLLVMHTTGSPRTVAAIADRARSRAIEVVDAPVSGGPADIQAGHVTLYAGATEVGLAQAEPLLKAYADPILHLGPPGAGQQMKLINNAVFAANIGIIAEAARLANGLGLDPKAVLVGLRHGSGDSRALAGAAAAGSVDDFGRAVGEFVGKDLAVVNGLVGELGLDLGALQEPHRVLAALLRPEHRALLRTDFSTTG